MGILTGAFNPKRRAESGQGPLSDFWYSDPSGYVLDVGDVGVAISADTILRCSTVLAAIRFRGDSWAMCQPTTYVRTPNGRSEEPTHYSQLVLRNPNTWMTGNRWRHLNGVWMGQWGNAYSEILAGPGTFAGELRPLHPSVTRVVDQRADGTLLYVTRRAGGREDRLGQERVLHFRDISTDGIRGVDMYRLIRNVVAIALLAEKHTASFLKKGARLGGVLVPEKKLDDGQATELRDSINAAFGGAANTGTYAVLPHGITLQANTATHRDSQFTEIGEQTVGAILRFLGVPGVVVGYADKTATYASAKEFFESGGIKHCVLPILTNVEAEEEMALLLRGDGRFIKHNLDVLLRANTKDRFEALFKAVGGPWMTRNEARRIEDMNEDPDPDMDTILTPSNMAPELLRPEPIEVETEDPPPARQAPPAPDDEDSGKAAGSAMPALGAPHGLLPNRRTRLLRLRPAPPDLEESGADSAAARARILAEQFALDAAARVVRKEIAAIKTRNGGLEADGRFAKDPARAAEWVRDYYGKHAEHVAETLHVPLEVAQGYADGQRDALLVQGVAVVETWEEAVAPQLAALALEESRC